MSLSRIIEEVWETADGLFGAGLMTQDEHEKFRRICGKDDDGKKRRKRRKRRQKRC